MRDILTALAGAVILILAAALTLPPFIGWEGHRDLVDRTIGRSLSLEARTEGRIAVRLLPSPRLRIDRLHLGGDPEKPGLDAQFVKAELALAPLLKGEFRFTQTRIGRAEVRLPVSESEAVLVPAGFEDSLRQRDLAIEDLEIQQFLLTTLVPATGRTDQFQASNLRLQSPALTGPWRVEGLSGGVPFRFATGEPGADGSLLLKVSGGGDAHPRFEADAKLRLVPVKPPAGTAPGADLRMPEAEGSARLVVGPPTQAAGAYLPFSLGGKFKAKGTLARFEGVNAEIDPGGQAIRLAGTGQIDLRAWRAGLNLESRRVDLDAFLLSGSGQALIARGLPKGRLPVMLDLDLSVESVALGLDEWADLKASGSFDRSGGLLLRKLTATAPGAAALSADGEIDTEPEPRFTGRLSLETPASDGLGRYLRKLGAEGPLVALMDGRPLQAGAEVSAARESFSLRNLRLGLGEARVTGSARYTPAGTGGRPRFDAQLAAQAIDIAGLPSFTAALAGLEGRDIGLTIEARDVRYGPAGARSGNGSITARVQSDGAGLSVERLDVANLSGANAALSGKIAADGSGRITGRLSAPAAAPLAALLDRVWVAEARLVPAFLRAGALDLAVSLERDAGAADTLRVSAKGSAAGGPLDITVATRAGRVETADIRIATPRTGLWFGREDIAGFDRPADLRIQGARAAGKAEPLALQVSGTLAGTALSTSRPLLLGPEGEPPLSGEVKLAGADIAPFLRLAGAGGLGPGPWPAELTLGFSRDGGARATVSGKLAGAGVEAQIVQGGDGSLGGSATVERLSLPQLAAALVIPAGPRAEMKGGWSTARFGAPPKPGPRIDLALRVPTLDLGRGLIATGTAFRLGLADTTLSLTDLTGKLADGRVAGSVALARQGNAASLSGDVTLTDASIPALADGSPINGRLGATFRFGASGESPAALVANLAGSGELALAHLTVPGADPGALERALTRALADDDPLREGRLQGLANEEFAKAAAGSETGAKSPATLIGGVLRAGPLDLALASARWVGSVGYDLRDGRLDARGTLTGGTPPKGWSGAPPAVQLGFSGPLSAPERSLDTTPLTSGLAALVLQRELEKIELLEIDQAERQRRRARIEMDKARAIALKAAADKAAAEEAARQARLKAQAAAAEEAARQSRIREADEAARRAREAPAPPPEPEGSSPLDIRPPAAQP